MTDRLHWCVVGGGMLGLVLALRLAQAGHRVTVLEAAGSTGGLAGAWRIDDVTWDRFYHVVLPGDRRLLELLDEIGLAGAVRWQRSRTGFFAGGRLSPLDSGLDYLRLPTLGLVAKVRIAFTLAMAARIRDGRHLDRVPVTDWLTRWSGRAAVDRLWRPLLRAKLGANDRIASALFIWATIRRLYLARSAGAKTEELGYVDGGYAQVLEALQRRLAEAGVTVQTGAPVRKVTAEAGGLRVETQAGSGRYDRVVSTLPGGATARLCADLSADIRRRLDGIVYQGIVCASVLLDRPLAGRYLTYITDPGLPFTAVVEMSALTGTARFGGRTLVYLPRYTTQDDAYWELDDDTVRARFVDGLRAMYPDLADDQIRAVQVARVRSVMAVPTVGYADLVPPVATNLPGFFIANSAQITDGTLNVDATLGVVERALPELLGAAPAFDRRSAA